MDHKTVHKRLTNKIKYQNQKINELTNRMVHLEERMGNLEYMNSTMWEIALKEFTQRLSSPNELVKKILKPKA